MSTKCLATTNQGKQCTRNAVPGSLFCSQHQKIESENTSRGRTLTKSIKSRSPSPLKTKSGKSRSPSPLKTTTVSQRSRSKSPTRCCVCLEETKDMLKCKHSICVDCTKQLYHPICPLCRRNLEGPTISKEVLKSIENRGGPRQRSRSRSPTTGSRSSVVRVLGVPRSRSPERRLNEAEQLLASAGVQPPSNWANFLKIYRRVTNFHRQNFPNLTFEAWVQTLTPSEIAEIIRQYILS